MEFDLLSKQPIKWNVLKVFAGWFNAANFYSDYCSIKYIVFFLNEKS